jgi:hypothetical protein
MPAIDVGDGDTVVQFLTLGVHASGNQSNFVKTFPKRVCKTNSQVISSLINNDELFAAANPLARFGFVT